MLTPNHLWLRLTAVSLVFLVWTGSSNGQQPAGSKPAATQAQAADLQQQLHDMTDRLIGIQNQIRQSQNDLQAVRAQLASLQEQIAAGRQQESASHSVASLNTAVEQLQESTSLIQAEVHQHDQTKVESSSKYPLRISGMLLFTSLLNSGSSDDADVPVVALGSAPGTASGNLTGSARQSILGLDGTGPHLWGARSSASVNLDFFAGFPWADTTTAAGTVRLRTARAALEWADRSLAVSFGPPILSPRQPTSWLSVGEPALAWSGYLWTWSPQLEFTENRILPGGHFSGQFAFIDPAAPGTAATSAVRVLSPAERSRQPGYEAHFGPSWSWGQRTFSLGAGGYYSRQTYRASRHIDAWAATADWDISPLPAIGLSGQIYRGRAIGGLGGGAFKDYVYDLGTSAFSGLNAEGGWAQVKVKLSSTLEANVAAGQDNALASDLRGSEYSGEQDSYMDLARNQNIYGNLVYRPRSYLVFSTEYRQLRSWPITGPRGQNRILGWAAGYLF
jgi:hypothetical protein